MEIVWFYINANACHLQRQNIFYSQAYNFLYSVYTLSLRLFCSVM